MYNTNSMFLIYKDSEGRQFSQHWEDLSEMGTLIDPETGEDLELIGWYSSAEHSPPPSNSLTRVEGLVEKWEKESLSPVFHPAGRGARRVLAGELERALEADKKEPGSIKGFPEFPELP